MPIMPVGSHSREVYPYKDKQKGGYDYVNKKYNPKVKYIIEFTTDQKVADSMNKANFDWERLNKAEFDYLEDAVNYYIKLAYEEQVLHLVMFEDISCNGEEVLEQSKNWVVPNILDRETQKLVEAVTQEANEMREQNEKFRDFLKKYRIEPNDVLNSKVQ